ncbi:MAG: VCBS repeat-containing protein [Planctomycetota bacterium]
MGARTVLWTALLLGCGGGGGESEESAIALGVRVVGDAVRVDEPFSLEVTARRGGLVEPSYTGRVRFECDDPDASLPTTTTFSADDRGRKVVSGFRMRDAGRFTLRAVEFPEGDVASLVLTVEPAASAPPVDVEPRGPARLVFDRPPAAVGRRCHLFEAADFDGDGDIDLFAASDLPIAQSEYFLLRNDGQGFFIADEPVHDRGWSAIAQGDIDSNGSIDVIGLRTNAGKVSLMINDGTGKFTLDTGLALYGHALVLGDLDGDDTLDLILADGNRIEVHRGLGQGRFALHEEHVADHILAFALADIDGDGDLDLLSGHRLAGNRVWRNDGGRLVDTGQLLGQWITTSIRAGDLDGDGDVDFVAGNYAGGSLPGLNHIWINDGDGRFVNDRGSAGQMCTIAVGLIDVDLDGDLDLVNGAGTARGELWVNDGSARFEESVRDHEFFNTLAVREADIDGDGDLDLLRATATLTRGVSSPGKDGIEIARVERD